MTNTEALTAHAADMQADYGIVASYPAGHVVILPVSTLGNLDKAVTWLMENEGEAVLMVALVTINGKRTTFPIVDARS